MDHSCLKRKEEEERFSLGGSTVLLRPGFCENPAQILQKISRLLASVSSDERTR